jgi:hypothetical protein
MAVNLRRAAFRDPCYVSRALITAASKILNARVAAKDCIIKSRDAHIAQLQGYIDAQATRYSEFVKKEGAEAGVRGTARGLRASAIGVRRTTGDRCRTAGGVSNSFKSGISWLCFGA